MKKKVSELTPAEFQKTFPIILEKHNPDYAAWYEEERALILRTIPPQDVIRISHIGSSAVKGLIAKPMIDILLEVDGCCNMEKLQESLKTIGFGTEVSSKAETPFRLLLAKGMTCDGFADRVYLLHVRYLGDWKELYFRDYLMAHPDIAQEYGALKQKILSDIENGLIQRMPGGQPNGYSQAKYAYVERISAKAKEEYAGRYKPKA
ncbi:MAG: GrpB family protein [Clostridiales bacterium]|nr:GrpB family protein [Clostridiales bacterium]